MHDEELSEWYFDWMYHIVCDDPPMHNAHYEQLLRHLDATLFRYRLRRDSNRAQDGIGLRRRFARQSNLGPYQSRVIFNDGPCTVLEMMIALAIRCEEELSDPFLGDQTSCIFWDMVKSLGLIDMTDRGYDPDYVNDVLTKFLDREYAPDGHGGLFTIENCSEDLRNVEIWYQLNWYLCSL